MFKRLQEWIKGSFFDSLFKQGVFFWLPFYTQRFGFVLNFFPEYSRMDRFPLFSVYLLFFLLPDHKWNTVGISEAMGFCFGGRFSVFFFLTRTLRSSHSREMPEMNDSWLGLEGEKWRQREMQDRKGLVLVLSSWQVLKERDSHDNAGAP